MQTEREQVICVDCLIIEDMKRLCSRHARVRQRVEIDFTASRLQEGKTCGERETLFQVLNIDPVPVQSFISHSFGLICLLPHVLLSNARFESRQREERPARNRESDRQECREKADALGKCWKLGLLLLSYY